MKSRTYRMTRRAELEAQTRQRITESAVALHGSLGPSHTSILAIAEHAGVRRSTVYRHFPDEKALFTACSTHWLTANPLPDLARWAAVRNPDERLRAALSELYAFYRRNEPMMANILRDEATMTIVRQMFGPFRQYLTHAQSILMEGRRTTPRARRRLRAALGHALAFHTWRSLALEQELGDDVSVELMCRLVVEARKL